MKVIDLINDLFDYRGLQPDKLPKKIRFNNNEFVFKDNSYYHENSINIMRYVDHTVDLRVEVEIIEDRCECIDKEVEKLFEEDKEIEKLERVNGSYLVDLQSNSSIAHQNEAITSLIMYLNKNADKINELVKAVNELKKGK